MSVIQLTDTVIIGLASRMGVDWHQLHGENFYLGPEYERARFIDCLTLLLQLHSTYQCQYDEASREHMIHIDGTHFLNVLNGGVDACLATQRGVHGTFEIMPSEPSYRFYEEVLVTEVQPDDMLFVNDVMGNPTPVRAVEHKDNVVVLSLDDGATGTFEVPKHLKVCRYAVK